MNPEILMEEAMRFGASDARVIRAADIPVEDAIVEMCGPPGCDGYGKSANCPPFAMTPEEARIWISRFDRAVFFKIDVEPELLFSPAQFKPFEDIFGIVSRLEHRAMEWGWKDVTGLGAGSCKPVFCPDAPCAALADGGKCRFPDLARPSMEAIGINVFKLAESVGWPIYHITRDTDPMEISSALLAGIVIVGARPPRAEGIR
ncbi:MAG: DUF2284 domain-containing protein [Deltaproteobacteria bacterium]|nr:DUF2284 domain-containing protein [Deltaproteobacteria bacterium]